MIWGSLNSVSGFAHLMKGRYLLHFPLLVPKDRFYYWTEFRIFKCAGSTILEPFFSTMLLFKKKKTGGPRVASKKQERNRQATKPTMQGAKKRGFDGSKTNTDPQARFPLYGYCMVWFGLLRRSSSLFLLPRNPQVDRGGLQPHPRHRLRGGLRGAGPPIPAPRTPPEAAGAASRAGSGGEGKASVQKKRQGMGGGGGGRKHDDLGKICGAGFPRALVSI